MDQANPQAEEAMAKARDAGFKVYTFEDIVE